MTLVVRAHAKINLHLEVLRRRDDGYHEIETIFQSIGLHDRLEFELAEERISIECSHPDVPEGRGNLAFKAAMELRHRLGVHRGATIRLTKNIPIAAGLGGGSANAAAVLRGLPRLWGMEVDDDLLFEIARSLGADVPFCLMGGTALGRGIGDLLTPLTSGGMEHYLLVTPPLAISSATAYERLNMGLTTVSAKISLAQYKSYLSRFPERGWPGANRLGEAILPTYPVVQRLWDALEATEPIVVMLSGSGPTLFAVYRTNEEALDAQQILLLPDGCFTWVGRPVRDGVRIL